MSSEQTDFAALLESWIAAAELAGSPHELEAVIGLSMRSPDGYDELDAIAWLDRAGGPPPHESWGSRRASFIAQTRHTLAQVRAAGAPERCSR